jgi:hypothetical protein
MTRLARFLALENVDEALTEGAALLADEAGVTEAAIFLADGNQPLRDFWHGSPECREHARSAFKSAALEATRTGARSHRAASGETGAVRAFPLTAGDRVLGAVCLPGRGRTTIPSSRAVATIAAILAARPGSRTSSPGTRSSGRATSDGSRRSTATSAARPGAAKFAAFVGQTDTFVFVTDKGARIGWANRAMCDLFPPEDGGSWIGSSCASVCSRLGGPCADVRWRARSSEAAVSHQELAGQVGGGEGLLYLTALPICGPNGTPTRSWS